MIKVVEIKKMEIDCLKYRPCSKNEHIKKTGWVALLSDGTLIGREAISRKKENRIMKSTSPEFMTRKLLIEYLVVNEINILDKKLRLKDERKKENVGKYIDLLRDRFIFKGETDSNKYISIISEMTEEIIEELETKTKQLEKLVLDNNLMLNFRSQIKDAAFSGGWTDDHELTAFEFVLKKASGSYL